MRLTDYLKPQLVCFLDSHTRDEALREIIHLLKKQHVLDDESIFYQAITDREKIVSTGIGMGVALPHAKVAGYKRFFIALAILKKAVAWDALDGAPVQIIFMIGGPDNKPTEYLQILSALTQAIKDEEKRKKLLNLQSSTAIVELFQPI